MNEIDTKAGGRSREEREAYYRERDRYFAERDRYYAERDRYYRGEEPEWLDADYTDEAADFADGLELPFDDDLEAQITERAGISSLSSGVSGGGTQIDAERIRREMRQNRARRSRAQASARGEQPEKREIREARRTEKPARPEKPQREARQGNAERAQREEKPQRSGKPVRTEKPEKLRREEGKRAETKAAARPESEEPKKKKKHPILLLLLLLLLGFAAFVGFKFVKRQSGYYTVAVFGVDSRNGNVGKGALSDVNIIARVDMESGEIKLVSIYRDTYTQISKDGDYHKFNEAYFRGGAEQAVWALEHNTDVKIDDYATFNWKAVVDTINILGGVDLEISDAEFAYINGFITETVNSTGVGSYQLEHAGMNHLDGVQAVAYARLRLMDNDYNRTERQRKVIALAFEKAKQADFATLNNILVTVLPQISTSVGVSDVMPFAKDIHKYYLGETAGFPFEKSTKNVGKMNCVIPVTWETNDIALHQFLYPETPYTPSALAKQISDHVAEKTGLGASGETSVKVDDLKTDGGSAPSANAAPAPAESKADETKPAESQTIEEIIDDTNTDETAASAEETTEAPSTEGENEADSDDDAGRDDDAVTAAPSGTDSADAGGPADSSSQGYGNTDHADTEGPQTAPAVVSTEGPGSLPDTAGTTAGGPGTATE